MNIPTVNETSKKKGDFSLLLARALGFTRYGRLFAILGCLGALGGLILYSYSYPVYYSRALLHWHVFGLPFHDGAEGKDSSISTYRVWQELKTRLEAAQLIKDTAVRLGVVKPTDDIDVVHARMKLTRLLYRDEQTLLIETAASDPRAVREFAPTLIQVYQDTQAKIRKEYREEAIQKYVVEVGQLKAKIDEELRKKLNFEQQSQVATLTMKQQELLHLPADAERCKAQIKRMEQIKDTFERNADSLDDVAKLSLLTGFTKEWAEQEKIKTGDVVRDTSTGMSPLKVQPPVKFNLVVKPEEEEAAEAWRSLEKELRSIQEEIREKSQKYLPGHEVMKRLNERLDEVNHQLSGELQSAMSRFDAEYSRVKQRLPEIEAQMPEYYDNVQKYEQFRKDYSLLEKGEEDWNTAHNELTKRIAAMQFGEQKDQVELVFGGYEVLNDSVPISPSAKKSLFVALALALALGVSLPMGLEYANNTVSRIAQLEHRLGLLGLGIVPVASKSLLDEVHRSPTVGARVPNFLLECFRVIRGNIILHPSSEGRSQVVSITSARPREGKSTLAANLAWAFYSMGERTLLVDTDTRRGRIHEFFDMDNSTGLASYLTGAATAEEIVKHSRLKTFDVVTRGPFIAGASEGLCQDVFENLVKKWRQEYDRIVLDGPPVLGLSETAMIQRVSDGVVMVVKAENTKIMDVESSVDQIRRVGANFFGFVINHLDLTRMSNHYYYYYYSPYYYNAFEESGNPHAATQA